MAVQFDVFLSYNRRYKRLVQALKKRLETEYRLCVWIDDSIRGGQTIDDEIRVALEASKNMILIVPPNGCSRWQQDELARFSGLVVPVLINNAPKSAVPVKHSRVKFLRLSKSIQDNEMDAIAYAVDANKSAKKKSSRTKSARPSQRRARKKGTQKRTRLVRRADKGFRGKEPPSP